jgi:glycyl-tRNA synthetase
MAIRSDRLDAIVSLSKRRGFVYPSSEIYGGLRAVWDYGPLGVELKNNVKRQWWRSTVQERDDVVGLDSSVILASEVSEASGHVSDFTDPLTECRSCHRRYRADHLAARPGVLADGVHDDSLLEHIVCPACGARGAFTPPRQHSAMLRTRLGPGEDSSGLAYLRPETAQGIFVNYKNVAASSRRKIPFGIAQVGKSFRNEITPGDFIFRTREFEQMELEYFVRPGTDEEWHQYWIDTRFAWYAELGVKKESLRRYEHQKDKLGHSKRTVGIEYRFGFAGSEWGGLEGIANRADYDLSVHQQRSAADLTYLDQGTGERFIPYAIGPAAGVDRALLVFLLDAYAEDQAPDANGKLEKRTVLRLDPRLAPVKVAVLPLSRNADLSPKARDVAAMLRGRWTTEFDDAGAIGRRYRRQDEIGTPFCVTVDFDSLRDQAVTVRERDSMAQDRVSVGALPGYLADRLPAW